MPEEEGFTVRDRRRAYLEEPAASDPTESAPISAATLATPSPAEQMRLADMGDAVELPTEEEMMAESQELPDVYSMLALFLSELRNLAWLRMGLVANPMTGQIERDMEQAKVAIDSVTFLAQQLESVVSPEERQPLRSVVSDLQANFIEQMRRGA